MTLELYYNSGAIKAFESNCCQSSPQEESYKISKVSKRYYDIPFVIVQLGYLKDVCQISRTDPII